MSRLLQRGFSLVEVLIGLCIVLWGLLGLARFEMAAVRYNRAAYFASVANTQASAVIECLRATQSAPSCESYFNTMLAHLLPGGQCILLITKQHYQLSIGWYEPQLPYRKKPCAQYHPVGFNCISYAGKL